MALPRLVTSAAGGLSCNPRARSASPPPAPVPPAFFLLLLPSPRHAEGMSPSWRQGPPVPEASPSLRAGHLGPRSSISGLRAWAGTLASAPKSSRRAPPSSAVSAATASRPPLTPRHPSQRSQFPKLPHPPSLLVGKLQPATLSPWPSPRGLACERPRPSQKERARRALRKGQEVAAAGNLGPW